jgi:2-hydroxychromene-2-carboxylate isomerase
MPQTLDFFFEFASSYSYPAAMRIGEIARAADVPVRWRPFLLGPIFQEQGLVTSPFNIYPAKGRYMWHDLSRTCQDLGLPFHRPDPFPQNGLLATRVAHVGLAHEWGEAFCRAVYLAEFGDGQQIGSEDIIRELLIKLGQQPEAVLARAHSNLIKEQVRSTTDEARRLGVFGAPNFVVAGELFWGNDRLEQAIAHAARVQGNKQT